MLAAIIVVVIVIIMNLLFAGLMSGWLALTATVVLGLLAKEAVNLLQCSCILPAIDGPLGKA